VPRIVHALVGAVPNDRGAISNSIEDLICLRHRRRLLLRRHAIPQIFGVAVSMPPEMSTVGAGIIDGTIEAAVKLCIDPAASWRSIE
jgi:hypothetical protein